MFNTVHQVHYRGGWPGLFSGENETKSLMRTLEQMNAQGLRAVGVATDRWSFFARLGATLLALVTLGFVVRHPNVLVIAEPMPAGMQSGQQALDVAPGALQRR